MTAGSAGGQQMVSSGYGKNVSLSELVCIMERVYMRYSSVGFQDSSFKEDDLRSEM